MRSGSLIKVGGVSAILVGVTIAAMRITGLFGIENFDTTEHRLLHIADHQTVYLTQQSFMMLTFRAGDSNGSRHGGRLPRCRWRAPRDEDLGGTGARLCRGRRCYEANSGGDVRDAYGGDEPPGGVGPSLRYWRRAL